MEVAKRPPRKKARNSLTAPEALLLNRLSEESLENIVRLASHHPRASAWTRFIREQDMVSLLRLKGPISAIARRLFKAYEPSESRWLSDDVSPDDIDVLRNLGSAAANSLAEIDIQDDFPAKFFTPHLPNLKVVRVHTGFSLASFPILRNCSVEKLHLHGPELEEDNIQEVGRRCTGLKSLRIETVRVVGDLEVLFERNGSSLEEISLVSRVSHVAFFSGLGEDDEDPFDWLAYVVPGIARHCTRLRKFQLKYFLATDDTKGHILSICTRNRTTLKSLELRGPVDVPFIKNVVQICPNVAFSVENFQGNEVEKLITMGRTANNILVWGPDLLDEEFTQSTVRQVCTACVNVSDVTLCVAAKQYDVVSEFFASPMSSLKTVTILLSDGENLDAVNRSSRFALLMSKCDSLETFNFVGDEVPDAESLRLMVTANKNLRKMHISAGCRTKLCRCFVDDVGPVPPEERLFSWGPTLTALRAGRNLQNIVLNCKKRSVEETEEPGLKVGSVADALVVFRWRKPFRALICGYEYEW